MIKGKKIFALVMICLLSSLFLTCADYEIMSKEPAAPVQLSIANATDSTVLLQWSMCEAPNFKSYAVYYSTYQAVNTNRTLIDTFYNYYDTTAIASGLLPNTKYYFKVIITTTGGASSSSNIADTFTNVSLKGKLNFWVSSRTATSVSLTWTHAIEDNIRWYKIFGDTFPSIDSKDRLYLTSYDTTGTISGLLPAKKYFFRVCAESKLRDTIVSQSDELPITTDSLP